MTKERTLFAPDRLFKVVLVGDSCVGKTSLLRSFCEGRFHPSSTTTVGESNDPGTLCKSFNIYPAVMHYNNWNVGFLWMLKLVPGGPLWIT